MPSDSFTLLQRDHDKEVLKRALAKQASKDATEYQKILGKKDEEIQQLNVRLKQLSQVTQWRH